MAADQSVRSSLDVPRPLKLITDWYKTITVVTAPVGVCAVYLLGAEKGAVIGVLSGVVFVVLAFAMRLYASGAIRVHRAIEILTSSTTVGVKDRRLAAEGLRKWEIGAGYINLALFGSLIAAFGYFLGPLAWNWYTTSKPKEIEFASLNYYLPDDESRLFEAAPFLEGVISSLREEGSSESRKFRILLGTTKPFTHPTPSFHCVMVHDERVKPKGEKESPEKYDISGYAFRKHPGDKGLIYEPVPIDYSKGIPLHLAIPKSERGDELFVVVRLSLQNGESFPDDPSKVIKLRLTD